ncbi:MAG: tetratricopeptide repeat protein [Candidatus Eisenbacteria bacterium]|nr:tetratricopeptide repeat protein [Candidatus Eisenbacteria bacterium]
MKKSGEHNTVLIAVVASVVLLGAIVVLCLRSSDGCSVESLLFTRDQQAAGLYARGEHEAAAAQFAAPDWQAAALYRDRQFESAAGIFVGLTSAEAAYNLGNSLVMQGAYTDAIKQYERALELRPGWEDAEANRAIAAGRAARLEREGGEMTGGMLGADEIVFDKKKQKGGGSEVVEGESIELSDEEMRLMWLRNVETKPADFLTYKFAYQYAMRGE